jgi:hypothetical protein
MTEITIRLIQDALAEEVDHAPQGILPVPENEIRLLESFWPYLEPHYRQFLGLFGGGVVRHENIYGLRLAPAMREADDVSALTTLFREDRWPGAEEMLIFTVDAFGIT